MRITSVEVKRLSFLYSPASGTHHFQEADVFIRISPSKTMASSPSTSLLSAQVSYQSTRQVRLTITGRKRVNFTDLSKASEGQHVILRARLHNSRAQGNFAADYTQHLLIIQVPRLSLSLFVSRR